MSLNNLLQEIKRNKKLQAGNNGLSYRAIAENKSYYALIVNAVYDNNTIRIDLQVFNTSEGTRRSFKFSTDKAQIYYDEICDTLGTSGDPSELIEKVILMHLERNGQFQNLKVESLSDLKALKKHINKLKEKEPKSIMEQVEEDLALPFGDDNDSEEEDNLDDDLSDFD